MPDPLKLTVRTPGELVAALPQVLGFVPRESLIVVPITAGLPVARIDLPHGAADRRLVVDELSRPYLHGARTSQTPSRVATVAVTDAHDDEARRTLDALSATLAPTVAVSPRLLTDQHTWTDLDTAQRGQVSAEAILRLAAEAVLVGRATPRGDRSEIAQALVGDRRPVADELPAAFRARAASSDAREQGWVLGRVEQFHHDGVALSAQDAARLLVGVASVPVRDAVWLRFTRGGTHQDRALWGDLTRRAPDEVRTPAASLLAFTAWLGGDGASAWSALDQIPPGHGHYRLAQLMNEILRGAVPPTRWDSDIRPALIADHAGTHREPPAQPAHPAARQPADREPDACSPEPCRPPRRPPPHTPPRTPPRSPRTHRPPSTPPR